MKVLGSLLLTLAVLSACSSPVEKEKCPCKVKVRVLQKDGTYTRETVELKTLEDLETIQSSKIRVTMNPRFFNDGTISESTPEAQYFVNKDNVIVPKTALSEQMFTLYKIMEDLFFFDKSIGLDKVLTYPRYISLQVKGSEAKNNGFYSPAFDRIRILTYDGDKAPLAWNPGVIAHEHFHAIFQKIVKYRMNTIGLDYQSKALNSEEGANQVKENTGFNYLILKALDEGLADYWANLHTGISDSYQSSYEDSENDRKVLPIVYEMDSQINLQKDLDFKVYVMEDIEKGENRPKNALVYGKAVMYSNLLKSISDKMFPEDKSVSSDERRAAQGEWIVSSLNKLSEVVYTKGKQETLTQSDILKSFVPDDKSARSVICSDLNNFLVHNEKVPACSGQ